MRRLWFIPLILFLALVFEEFATELWWTMASVRSEDDIPLPLFVKFHKTGGTSVASTLARSISVDRAYNRRPLIFCGNYDGHWGLLTYRNFGASGMRLCGGYFRRNAKLVTVLRNPVERFVSRIYFELGGRTKILLSPPFSEPIHSWSPEDVATMEGIMCDECVSINGGHCHWRGGVCDTPQEYLAVLGRLGTFGMKSGELQSDPPSKSVSVSLPAPSKRRKQVLDDALLALRRDFAVVGVIEELDTFWAALAYDLGWSLDHFLYRKRKAHDDSRRLSADRREERNQKRKDALQYKSSSLPFHGVFPLLGWNNRSSGPMRPETEAYARSRNSEDVVLWQYARDFARRKAPGDMVSTFKLLQRAYEDLIVPNSIGCYVFEEKSPRCRLVKNSKPCDITDETNLTISADHCTKSPQSSLDVAFYS